jgi:NADPH:quinone reductase-like Zn-dependent oxidoreductase
MGTAEFVSINSELVAKKPKNCSEEAAGLPLTGNTSLGVLALKRTIEFLFMQACR